MKRVLTSAILTFTLFTQPTYAQFAGGMSGGFSGGYSMPSSGYQGVGYYPAMQSCPYNNGMYQGAHSAADDTSAADALQTKIDAAQAKLDEIQSGGDSDISQRLNISAIENDLQAILPSGLFALAITDHMENGADCSCAPQPQAPVQYDQNQRPKPKPAPGSTGATTSMNDAPACLQFDTPDFVGQYPAAFTTVDNSWDVPASTLKIPKMTGSMVAAHKAVRGDRAPANDTPAPAGDPVPKKKAPKKEKGPDPQAPVPVPAPVATQPAPPAPAPVSPLPPPLQACLPGPAPSSNSCPGAGQWYPNGVCKPKGGLDARICSNEFVDSMDGLSAAERKHHSGEEITKCKRDLDDLHRLLEKRDALKKQIAALEKAQDDAYLGVSKKGDHIGMESNSGGNGGGTNKLGLILGAGLSVLGGVGGYFGAKASSDYACSMNAKLGYPCNGNNWGAVQAGISGLGVGVPVMMASIYSGAASGGAAGCGMSPTPYGMQPGYGMGGVPGMGGAFGYPQGYGPQSQFMPGMNMGAGYGALMPGMGPFSQGMANPYGSPFGASPFGGMGGAYGGLPGMSPFGGYGGANIGFGSGAVSPYGMSQYGGYNPYGASNEMAYRLGYENPMGYAANMQSAQAILQNASVGLNQINGGYGGYAYGAYGAGSPYAYGYSPYGSGSSGSGGYLSAGFNLGYGSSNGYSPYGYSGYNPYSNYNVGYSPSFAQYSPYSASNVFGPSSTTTTGTTTGAPFGR